jgi:hypothetical protein
MSRITGSKLFQEGLQAWNERRRSRGPLSPNFCPVGAPSKDPYLHNARGTLQALRRIKPHGFYRPSTPYGFHSVPRSRNVHSWPSSYPPFPVSAFTSLLVRFALCESFSRVFDVSLQHVRARTSSSSSRSARLAVADYADHPVRSLSPVCMERPQEPLSSFLLCVRCRALSFRRCLIT